MELLTDARISIGTDVLYRVKWSVTNYPTLWNIYILKRFSSR